MRVLTVSHFYENHGGGIERVASHLCRQFFECGHQVFWAASSEEAPAIDGVTRVPLRCYNPIESVTGLPIPMPSIGGAKALYRAVKTCDAVVIHDALYMTSILAMILAKMQRKQTVLIQHIGSIGFASRALRLIFALADRFVTRLSTPG